MKQFIGVPFRRVLEKKLKDPSFRMYFNESKALSELCIAISEARHARGITQIALAKLSGTTQSVIARLESGNNGRMPSLELLGRIAKALKLNLVVGFEEKKAV